MGFEKILNLGGPLLLGAVTTVEITLASLVLAIVIGLGFALLKLSRFKLLHWAIDIYVELFRGTPVLAQLFIIYFGLAYMGFKVASFPAAIIGLGLNGGAVLTESIFGWPGLGQLAVTAIAQRDIPLVQGVVLVFAIMFAAVNLAVDLLNAVLDPRIRMD